MLYENIKDLNILYIEDDSIIAENFTNILTRLKAKVTLVSNYKDATKQFDIGNSSFDIIITDVRLSSGTNTGLDFARFVRAFDKNVTIIVTSAYDKTDYLLDAIDCNVNKYFIKPFKEVHFFEYLDSIGESIKKTKNAPANNNSFETKKVSSKSENISLADGFIYSYKTKTVNKDNEEIALTAQEITLIELLILNKGKIVEYEDIFDHFKQRGNKQLKIDTLRTVTKNIRKKTSSSLIATLSNIGYKIS